MAVPFTLRSPIFYHLYSNSSIPISNFSQRSQLSLNPVKFTGFKACSSCSYPLNSRFHNLGFFNLGRRMNADRICTTAVSGGDSGGLGGSGNGNSGGGGDSGEDNWYLEMFATFAVMLQFLTPALLNCIGDLFRQLVIEQAPSLDVKRTVISTSMGLPLVGHTLLFWSLVDREISAFNRSLDIIFHGLAFILFVVVFFCFRFLSEAYAVITKKLALGDEIESLPKYRYCQNNQLRPIIDRESLDSNLSIELSLLPEDLDCCICLCRYKEGEELNCLPCKHHFHCECISKWLRINATCPICKSSIQRGDDLPR